MLTTVQGLDKAYDAKKVLKAFKKEFACNGTVVSSEEAELDNPAPTAPAGGKAKQNFGQVIQLQGDQRAKIREFLISTGMVAERDAKEKIQMWVLFERVDLVTSCLLMIRFTRFVVISVTVTKSTTARILVFRFLLRLFN
jgi:translation initiation factor 1 (eIF-1/SUI1)